MVYNIFNFVHYYCQFSLFSNRYDIEAMYFDEEVRNAKRRQLMSRALEVSLEHSILLQKSSPLIFLLPAMEKERGFIDYGMLGFHRGL